MAMKKCTECQAEVSSKADACPSCGAKVKKTSPLAMGCLSVIVLMVMLAVVGAMRDKKGSSTSAASSPAPVEEIRWLNETCKATATDFGLRSKLTDLQKKAAWEERQLDGVHFKWKLRVTSVDTTFGKLQAQFKCKGSKAFVSDVILGVDDEAAALKLVKGQFYEVHGTLDDYGSIVGLSGDLVEIME